MSTPETQTRFVHSKARMPFRIAAGVLAVLSPLGLIPLGAGFVEEGSNGNLAWLAFGALGVLVCTFMFARTALTGWTPMYTSALIKLAGLADLSDAD